MGNSSQQFFVAVYLGTKQMKSFACKWQITGNLNQQQIRKVVMMIISL